MSDLVRDLGDPANYPDPRPSGIAFRETHLSWVFLTDREAWKIKKPVDFGFVDATSLEKRRRLCDEEVRLNRRLAPDVYLGVESLRRDARGFSFNRGGEVVDAAVRMKRLPDAASAGARLAAGTLTDDDLDRLADLLVRFYRAAPADPAYGDPAILRRNVAENFDQVRPFVGRFVDADLFEEVRARQESQGAVQAERLASRVRAGHIRDGHGDLRLEHVYFLGGDPVVIDAIEFNPRFRIGDVALDVAFFAMELTARGAATQAESFMGRFAQASDDYDFYPLLDFYLGYRAWVRAKVACFMAADEGLATDKRERKRQEARALFSLARTFATPGRPSDALIAVGGLIGSGKSTLARALGRTRGLAVVSSDLTRKRLAGLAPTEPGGPELYDAEFSRRVYVEVFRRAGEVLASGRGVVIDATFRSRADRQGARSLAARFGVPFRFVETHCRPETLRERLRSRTGGPSVSDAREDLLDAFRREFEPVTELPPAEHVRVDSERPTEEMIRDVSRPLRFP